MNLTELMKGDWVSYKGKPHKVNGIEDNHLYLKNSNGCIIMALPDEITPVPITGEILKKNAFQYTICREYRYENDLVDVTLCTPKPGLFWIAIKNGDSTHTTDFHYLESCICYVHEFQHGLHTCKLDKNIEL